MELAVYNIKGEDTGRKVELSEEVFGIEPNEHAIYLDVKQYLANQRQGTHKSKERSEVSGSTRKLAAAAVSATSTHLFWWVADVYSVPVPATIVSSSTRR